MSHLPAAQKLKIVQCGGGQNMLRMGWYEVGW
jgi:hypothetical protein